MADSFFKRYKARKTATPAQYPNMTIKGDYMKRKSAQNVHFNRSGTGCNTMWMTKKTKSHVRFASITLANLVTPLVQILKTRTCLSRVTATLELDWVQLLTMKIQCFTKTPLRNKHLRTTQNKLLHTIHCKIEWT
jgi:hypothetical protein